MDLYGFCDTVGNEEAAREFFRANGLLRRVPPACQNLVCRARGVRMSWVRGLTNRPSPFVWRCGNCGRKTYERVGSIFENGNLPLTKYLAILHFWSNSISVKAATAMTQLPEKTVIQWYKTFRSLCRWWLVRHPRQIGGRVGGRRLVVEIDESLGIIL